jgi:hypothetical protein
MRDASDLKRLPPDRPDMIAEYLHAGRRRSGDEANANQARFY